MQGVALRLQLSALASLCDLLECLRVLFAGLVGCGCLLGDLRALILRWLLLGVMAMMSVFFLLLIG